MTNTGSLHTDELLPFTSAYMSSAHPEQINRLHRSPLSALTFSVDAVAHGLHGLEQLLTAEHRLLGQTSRTVRRRGPSDPGWTRTDNDPMSAVRGDRLRPGAGSQSARRTVAADQSAAEQRRSPPRQGEGGGL